MGVYGSIVASVEDLSQLAQAEEKRRTTALAKQTSSLSSTSSSSSSTSSSASSSLPPSAIVLSPPSSKKGSLHLVESLRRLAELVVFGDRTDNTFFSTSEGAASNPGLFEYFCEKNTLTLLVDVVTGLALSPPPKKEGGRRGALFLPPVEVSVQVIQTISILVSLRSGLLFSSY